MAAEVNLRNKTLHKVEILLLKFIPFIVAGIYFINTVLSIYMIDVPILSYIAGISLLPFIFILLSSFVFKFCVYHRIPLYYILVNDTLNTIDSYYDIPVENRAFLILHLTIFFVCFITVFVLRKKCNRNDEHNKKISL